MEPILTRCGNRCDLCRAYRPNIEQGLTDRQKLSDGWFKYFGFRLQPEEICCDGCMVGNGRSLDTDCPVRPCVITKGLGNCAQCEQYICEKLTQRLTVLEEVKQRVGADIPGNDYVCFIQPYENKLRLDALRTL